MKRIILLTIVSGLYMMSSAQLLVKQNGRVGIGVSNTSQNLYNKLSVFSNTSTLSTLAYFRADSCDTGLGVSMGDQKSSTTYRCALAVDNELNPNTHCIGIQTTAFRIYVGRSVIPSSLEGNVFVNPGNSVIFDAEQNVYIKDGFILGTGSKFEIK